MAHSDEIPEMLLSKTNSGKLVWEDGSAMFGNNTVTLSLDENDHPVVRVQTSKGESCFYDGETVKELHEVVERLPVTEDSDFIEELKNL